MPFCTRCGHEVATDAVFCSACGNKIKMDFATASTPASATLPSTTASTQSLLELDNVVLKKKAFSLKQRYDFEDIHGRKLAEAEAGIIAKLPTNFGVYEWTLSGERGQELLRIESKVLSIRHECTLFEPSGSPLASVKRTVQVNPFGSSLHSFWVEDPSSGEKLLEADGPAPLGEYKLMRGGKPAVEVQRRYIGTLFGGADDYRYPTEIGIAIIPGTDLDHRILLGSVLAIDFIGRLGGEQGVGATIRKDTPPVETLAGEKGGLFNVRAFAANQLERARQIQESLPPEKRMRAITCSYCHAWNPRSRSDRLTRFCIMCAKPLPIPENEIVSCPKCNADMPAEANKCPKCGKKF